MTKVPRRMGRSMPWAVALAALLAACATPEERLGGAGRALTADEGRARVAHLTTVRLTMLQQQDGGRTTAGEHEQRDAPDERCIEAENGVHQRGTE